MLEYRASLQQLLPGLGEPAIPDANLEVTRLFARRLLLLQSSMQTSLQEAVRSEIGLQLPEPQRVSLLGDHALLWMAPAEWLLELPATEIDSVQSALTRRLASSLAATTDMSEALVSFQVSGDHAAEILMSGCSLDLRTRAFPAGRVARTVIADVPAIIWNPGRPDRFRCLIDRSVAEHFWDWLNGINSCLPPP